MSMNSDTTFLKNILTGSKRVTNNKQASGLKDIQEGNVTIKEECLETEIKEEPFDYDVCKQDELSVDMSLEEQCLEIEIKEEPLDYVHEDSGGNQLGQKNSVLAGTECVYVTDKNEIKEEPNDAFGLDERELVLNHSISDKNQIFINNLDHKTDNRRQKGKRALEIEQQKLGKRFKLLKMLQKEYEKEFSCNVCHGSFKSKANLESHLMTHILEQGVKRERLFNTKIFKCVDCGYESHYKANICQHLLTHENKMLYKCSGCDFGSNYKGQLRRHMLSQHRKKLNCPECNYECYDRDSLSNHVVSHENKSYEETLENRNFEDIHQNRNLWKCSECNFECSDLESLRHHMVSHVVLFNLSMHGNCGLRGRWESPRLPTSWNEENANIPYPPK